MSAESPATAVAVGNWVVVFATEGRFDSPVTYDAPEGTTHHLVVDLPPQSMWQLEGPGGASRLSTGDEGVVSFDAGGGTIHLVEVPARGGPGHM